MFPRHQPQADLQSISLIAYFRSGWAFLIPYLAAYLLYAWLKWPVNPAGPLNSQLSTLSSQLSTASPSTVLPPTGIRPPCLLHVYWFLHALHLMLGAQALRTWWRNSGATVNGETDDDQETANGTNLPQTSTTSSRQPSTVPHSGNRSHPGNDRLLATLYRLLPWLCLALIFWIPGVYLEWPSDPWEHYRRITEWATQSTIGTHSAGYKSFYFFAYSFLSNAIPNAQTSRLDVYTTLLSTLLAWQYFRLAKEVGLDDRWAFVSVLANTLLFGNVCFSFYRYYALASTMYSQLGVVALTRIVVAAVNKPKLTSRSATGLRSFAYRPMIAGILLLTLIATNHIQGIGIAGLCILSIAIWGSIQRNPSMIWWVASCTIALSFSAYFWWPRHPTIDTVYRAGGWLNGWYGFNIIFPSPAADRFLQIIGVFGLLNLLAGFILLRRNHVVGWLTVGPIVALTLPCVALPFANSLAKVSAGEIITFHRMLFAVPSGLALTCCLLQLKTSWLASMAVPFQRFTWASLAMLTMVLVSLTPNPPYYNRIWHLLSTTPADLELRTITLNASTAMKRDRAIESSLLATDAVANVFRTVSPKYFSYRERPVNQPAAKSLDQTRALILSSKPATSSEREILNNDPSAINHAAWITFGGYPPEFVGGINDSHGGPTALQNPTGHSSEVFSSDAIPIDHNKSYRLEMSVKQLSDTLATTYLAVAWYNDKGNLLAANRPVPEGAGNPVGWSNGTYSYFGLIAGAAPTAWTTYRISFGQGEIAELPPQVTFVRIGALLNYNFAPDAEVRLANVQLWEKKKFEPIADGTFPENAHYFVFIPDSRTLFTHASQASQVSNHWFAQQLSSDLAGGEELKATANSTGRAFTNADDSRIELTASGLIAYPPR